MCIKRKIISSLGVSVLVFNVSLSTPIFANEYETNLEIQNEARYTVGLIKREQFQEEVAIEYFQQWKLTRGQILRVLLYIAILWIISRGIDWN